MAERDDLKDTRKKDLREESMKDNELKQSGSASALEDSRSEGMQSYDKTRNLSTEVLSDTTNEDLKDVRARSVRGNANNQMRRLKIGGESLVRRETDKQGREKFRDETSGQYATEERFDDSESRVASLANSIRKGKTIGAMEENTSTLGFGAAKASSGLSKNIGDNAGTLQEIFEKEGDETQAELKKLVELIANAQDLKGKDAEKAKNEISKQVSRLEIKAGDNKDKINQALGLDNVKKDLRSGSRIKEALNIDQGATGLTAVKQAFSPTRLFGDANTGGLSGGGGIMSNLASKVLGTGDSAADAQQAKNARMEIAKEDQAKGMAAAVGAEGLQLIGEDEVDVKSPTESKKTKEPTIEKESSNKEPTIEKESSKEIQTNTITEENTIKVAKARATSTKPGDGTFKSGIDKESTGQKQVELLEDIKDILEDVAAKGGMGGGGGGGGGGGFFGRGGKSKLGKIGGALKGAGRGLLGGAGALGGGIMRGASKLGGAGAGAALSVGMGAYEAISGVMSAENKMENLEISAEEAQSQKGEAIGSGAGGAAGGMAGMAAGAAIGSVVPIVGTAIGGIIGGALGYFGGSWLGGKAGEALADAIPVDPGEIAESNEAALVALDKIEEVNPELRAEIEKQAEDNYQALLGDKSEDEYSDNDKAAMKNAGLVKAIQNQDEAIQKLQAEGANVDLSKLESTNTADRKQAAVEHVAQEMGIDPSKVEAKVEMGKITEINGQAVPEDLQKKSMEMMYPDSGAGQSDHPFLADSDEQGKGKTLTKTEKQSGAFVYANLTDEQQDAFDEAVMEKSQQYRAEFKKENEGKEKGFMHGIQENMQDRRARRDVEGEILKTGGVLGDKEALIQQGAITGDYATGNVKRGYEIDGKAVTEKEYNAELDRGRTGMMDDGAIDPDTVHVEQGKRHAEFLANRQAEKTGTPTSDALEQGTMTATASRGQPVPTGTALENMPSSQNAPAPVINNVTNNSGGGASKEPRVVVANAPTPRPNTNTIERYQDRRYRG